MPRQRNTHRPSQRNVDGVSHRNIHRTSTRVMSILMIGIGVAIFVRTLVAGGGALATGVVLGALFVAAGAARLYLQHRG